MNRRGLLGVGLLVVWLIGAIVSPTIRSVAYASDPTLDAAIYQATVRAGETALVARQTQDARAQADFEARQTASALDLKIKADQATQTAFAQQTTIVEQATQRARNVQATATEQAARNAQATAVAVKTVQAEATNVAATVQMRANQATATTQAGTTTAIAQQTVSAATAQAAAIHATATVAAYHIEQNARMINGVVGIAIDVAFALLVGAVAFGIVVLALRVRKPAPIRVAAEDVQTMPVEPVALPEPPLTVPETIVVTEPSSLADALAQAVYDQLAIDQAEPI